MRSAHSDLPATDWISFWEACDVSGLQTITHKPTVMHSGVVVTRVFHRISGRDIGISVVVNTRRSARRAVQSAHRSL